MRSKITVSVLSLTTLGVFVCLAQAQTKSEKKAPRSISISDLVQNPGLLDELGVVEAPFFRDSDADDTMEAGGLGNGGSGFGQNIAGAFYQCPGGAPPDGCSAFGQSIKTIHKDGTLVARTPNADETAAYGNWKKVGPKTIEVTAVIYGVGAIGENGVFVARVTETMTFANGFNSYTGLINTAVWFGADTIDLNDPDRAPEICAGPFEISGQRLGVQFPSCTCAAGFEDLGIPPSGCEMGEVCVDGFECVEE